MCFRPPVAVEGPKNCPKCGAEVPTGAAKCLGCGAAKEETSPAAAGAALQVPVVLAPGAPAASKVPGAPGAPTPPPAPGA